MDTHAAPPFDPWLWTRACHETWLAALDRDGAGRRLREARLARLIRTALRESPLYARRSGAARTLGDFEPVTKALLMEHFDDWATDRRITRSGAQAFIADAGDVADAWLGRYLLWTSSGTSGTPGLFVQDAASLAACDAIDALRLRAVGRAPGALGFWGLGRCFAYVGAIGGRYAGHVSMQRLRRIVPAPWAPRIELLSVLEPLPQLIEGLQALQPDVIVTYPSCAAALALAQEQGALHLHLDELWMGGEQLGAATREAVRSAFGCTVRNSYGASEFYSIAFECAHARLHLNDDWVILEPVDAQWHAVPAGVLSHTTLLTNLANLTQPLLRYELPDRVCLVDTPCACGSPWPVIEVQGRADDALILPGRGRDREVTLLPLALETAIEEGAGVAQFQLLRHRDGRLEMRLEAGHRDPSDALARARRAAVAFLVRHGVADPRVAGSRKAPLRQPGSGKLRRVIDLGRAG